MTFSDDAQKQQAGFGDVREYLNSDGSDIQIESVITEDGVEESDASGQYVASHPSKTLTVISVNRLVTRNLSSAISVIVEPDGDGFIARNADLPLYGWSEDFVEAIRMLQEEIESFYEDIRSQAILSNELIAIKAYLEKIIE